MTILTQVGETVPYKAPWREDEPDALEFTLRGCDVIERGQMEAELSGKYRAGRVFSFEFERAIDSGVAKLLDGDPEQGRVIELLAAEREYVQEVAKAARAGLGVERFPSNPLSSEDQALLSQVREVLSQHWAPYIELTEQAARRREIAPLIALRRFCVDITGKGINGKPIAFTRGPDGKVSNATLALIEQFELTSAGNRAYNLQYPDADTEKNSAPLSKSGDSPAPSSSDEPLPTDTAGK